MLPVTEVAGGIIHVRRQILRQNSEVVEAPLKTKNSYRNIAMGADTIKVLKGMEQKDEYVFSSSYGGSMLPDSVLHMLQRVLKRAGLERIRFHDLRHTFSDLALQNGVDVILFFNKGFIAISPGNAGNNLVGQRANSLTQSHRENAQRKIEKRLAFLGRVCYYNEAV